MRLLAAVATALVLASSETSAQDVPWLAQRMAYLSGQSAGRAAEVLRAIDAAEPGELRVTLAAIAVHESHLRREVEDCSVVGDGGLAVGIWQEHAVGQRRERLCSGGAKAQARMALWRLRTVCRGSVACYAGRRDGHVAVRDVEALVERMSQ